MSMRGKMLSLQNLEELAAVQRVVIPPQRNGPLLCQLTWQGIIKHEEVQNEEE